MPRAMSQVVDAIDIETFLYCKSEEEGRQLAEALAVEMNLNRADIVFLEYQGWGARVRMRTYVHRPGDHYGWLEERQEAE